MYEIDLQKYFQIWSHFLFYALKRLKDTQIIQIRNNTEKWLPFHKAKFQFLGEHDKLQNENNTDLWNKGIQQNRAHQGQENEVM